MKLPYEIIIPNTIFEEELLKFSEVEKASLLTGGLCVTELPGEGVLRAQEIESKYPALSIHDSFAFTLAERNPGCILLTGDNNLRKIAAAHEIEVHGALWIIAEIRKSGIVPISKLIAALQLFENDPTIRLPKNELKSLIEKLKDDLQ